MCMIIYKPEGKKWNDDLREQMEYCFSKNKDGCGLMIRDDSKVYMTKGIWGVEHFYRLIRGLPETAEIAIHFRFTSAGKTSQEMCHPFSLNKNDLKRMRGNVGAGLMHNGTIHNLCFQGKHSDTYYLADMLNEFSPAELVEDRMIDMIDTVVSGSRVLIFTGDTTLMFGDWVDVNGIQYSNRGFKREEIGHRRCSSHGEYFLEFDRGSNSYVRKSLTF